MNDESPANRDSLEEILCALDLAESRQEFVPLEWFRDEMLPAKGYSWSQDPDERQKVLSKAISDGWILTGEYIYLGGPPISTLEVNRGKRLPSEVQRNRRFRPVPISGEPLSATILRDRGPR
jgi:hypothetical protein